MNNVSYSEHYARFETRRTFFIFGRISPYTSSDWDGLHVYVKHKLSPSDQLLGRVEQFDIEDLHDYFKIRCEEGIDEFNRYKKLKGIDKQ